MALLHFLCESDLADNMMELCSTVQLYQFLVKSGGAHYILIHIKV